MGHTDEGAPRASAAFDLREKPGLRQVGLWSALRIELAVMALERTHPALPHTGYVDDQLRRFAGSVQRVQQSRWAVAVRTLPKASESRQVTGVGDQ